MAAAPLNAASLTNGPVAAANFHKGTGGGIFTSVLGFKPNCFGTWKQFLFDKRFISYINLKICVGKNQHIIKLSLYTKIYILLEQRITMFNVTYNYTKLKIYCTLFNKNILKMIMHYSNNITW